MSFFGLSLMGKSLDAFQYALNATSDNIANVNTPGASRQIVDLSQAPAIVGSPFYAAHGPGTSGDGVTVSDLQRIHADSYDSLFRGASASQNFFSVQQNQLNALQGSLGEPNGGINTQYTAFQTAINQLVAQAGGGSSTSSRANVLAQAQALTQALNQASNTITMQKAQVFQQAGAIVTKANGVLDQIAALNQQIRASTAVGDNPNTFKDQRDQLIDQLSQYISTQTSIQPDGSTLVTVNGQALVNDAVVYHLAQPAIGTAADGTQTFKVDFASNPPAAANAPGVPLGSGQLAGFADLYNNKLTTYGTQLDNFASSLANEVNRVTQAGYDQNGIAGQALFQPIVASLPITAGNIKVGIANPAQLPAALASTAAGTLVVPLNSANNKVDTSAQINNNQTLANPPAAAGTTGTLTVTVDGAAQTFAYSSVAGGNADTIDNFISNFNGAHLGVSASFDVPSQRVVFARDPANTDLTHRAAQGANPTTPGFTIAELPAPTTGAGILAAVGAAGIDSVPQSSANAFGASDNGAANALLKIFSANVGVPALQTVSTTAVAAPGINTIALPAGPPPVNNVRVGDVLTIDAGTANQENVVVSAININGAGVESITATFANAHIAAGFSVSSAQTQSLGQYYGQTVTQIGLDAQTAITGTQTQTNLTKNIDQVRQSIDGINIDEETQNLIKYQNAYQAAARTINVLDSLLNTVVNSLGIVH
jgi:flagellar hook-associated protein 1 FlgK